MSSTTTTDLGEILMEWVDSPWTLSNFFSTNPPSPLSLSRSMFMTQPSKPPIEIGDRTIKEQQQHNSWTQTQKWSSLKYFKVLMVILSSLGIGLFWNYNSKLCCSFFNRSILCFSKPKLMNMAIWKDFEVPFSSFPFLICLKHLKVTVRRTQPRVPEESVLKENPKLEKV